LIEKIANLLNKKIAAEALSVFCLFQKQVSPSAVLGETPTVEMYCGFVNLVLLVVGRAPPLAQIEELAFSLEL